MNIQLNQAREFLNANPVLHAHLKSGAFVVCQKVKAKPVFICIDEEQVLISESDVSLKKILASYGFDETQQLISDRDLSLELIKGSLS